MVVGLEVQVLLVEINQDLLELLIQAVLVEVEEITVVPVKVELVVVE